MSIRARRSATGARQAPHGRAAASLIHRVGRAGPVPPEHLHVQFGADAATQVAISWAARAPVPRPRLRFGPVGGSAPDPVGAVARAEVQARGRAYTDALTGETAWTYHARLGRLEPDTRYAYEVLHDGVPPAAGTFRTGPAGRSRPFRFTSFGDQSIPEPVGLGLGPHSANAGYVVDAVEELDPLFHLLNGDLCYANASDQPVATWAAFFGNITRSARHRPWMPAAGNHENEAGNGPQGYLAYQTRFALPGNGSARFAGNWYAFTVGAVRVLSLHNDDVCLQDGGFSEYRRDHVPRYQARRIDPYVSGYSAGLQRRWLERELAAARTSPEIDWIVVFMHQVAMSSARFNGADLGIRRQWLPLFDAYGVDLVLAGHEHHFERTFPVRGTLPASPLLTPAPRGSDPGEMSPEDGTVYLTIGGGGNPATVPPPAVPADRQDDQGGVAEGFVITGVGEGGPLSRRRSVIATEPAPWLAYREREAPFGFAAFDVVPAEPGGTTSITVTYYGAEAGSPAYLPRDQFVLRKSARPERRAAGELATSLRSG